LKSEFNSTLSGKRPMWGGYSSITFGLTEWATVSYYSHQRWSPPVVVVGPACRDRNDNY